MKECNSCHTSNRDSAKYCKECGSILMEANPFINLVGKDELLEELKKFKKKCKARHHLQETVGAKVASEQIGLDCIILGDSGTGKNYLAELLKDIALSEKVISKTDITVIDAFDVDSAMKTLDATFLANSNGIIHITNAQKIISENFSREVSSLDKLFKKMKDGKNKPIIFISGLTNGMDIFIKKNPEAVQNFEFVFPLKPFQDKDLMDLTCLQLQNTFKVSITDAARKKMTAHYKFICRKRDDNFENAHMVSKKAADFYTNMLERGGDVIEDQDIQGPVFIPKTEQEIMDELNSFVGLQEVKNEIKSIIDTLKAEKRTKGPDATIRLKDHFVFLGNPGTGKTTIARVFADILNSMDVLPSGQLIEVTRKDLVGAFVGSTAIKVEQVVSKAIGGVLFIDEAYSLKNGDSDTFGQEAIDTLLPLVENRRGEFICIIAGYAKEMGEFLKTNSGLESRFNRTITFPDYKAPELHQLFKNFVNKGGYLLSDDAKAKLPKFFDKMYLGRKETFGNGRDVRNAFDLTISRLNKRRSKMSDDEFNQIGNIIEWQDIVGDEEAKELSVDDVMKKLDSFVGMQSVKQAIHDLADEIALNRKRIEAGVGEASLTPVNIILTGKPGTGKTSIARVFGELFKAMGITSSSNVIEKSRKDLVSAYANQSDKMMDKAVNEAMGGVLFIDEAYALAPFDESGFCNDSEGIKALERLMTRMENDRGKFVVVCAGYKDKMSNLFKANDGFRSRFTHEINIDDYTAEELTQIFEGFVSSAGLKLRDEIVREKVTKMFEDMILSKNDKFGNAREARKKFDETKRLQSKRLQKISSGDLSRDDLITISAEDIPYDDRVISVEDVMSELDEFIGMDSVKKSIRELAEEMAFNKERQAAGIGKSSLITVNIILTGNPGTGKTSVARVLGRLFKAIGITKTDKVVERSRKDIVGQFVNQSDKMMDEAINDAMGGVLFLDEAYSIAPVDELGHCNDSEGIKALERLMTRMENDKGKFVVVCAGYKDKMEQFLRANQGLPRRFTHRIHIDDYSAPELCDIYSQFLRKEDYHFDDDAVRQKALKMFEQLVISKTDSFGNAGEARKLFEQTKRNLANRIRHGGVNITNPAYMTTVTLEDIPYEEPEQVNAADCLKELDELIGLNGVKTAMHKLIDTINVQQQIAKTTGSKTNIPIGHYMFLGNPGTGKTTVARMMGKILYSMGAIARPDVLEVDKSQLVAGYVGQSEEKTRETIQRAMGGILFIDEAYELASDQFGKNSLDILLKQLEDKRGQFVCIVAGYTKEMQSFINSNSGLASRFPSRNCITFEDYDPKELYDIFKLFCSKEHLSIDPDAETVVKEKIQLMYQNRDSKFGNARDVRNLFDSIKMNQSSRISKVSDASLSELTTIKAEDVL